jgi:hypothetical protein
MDIFHVGKWELVQPVPARVSDFLMTSLYEIPVRAGDKF